MSVSDGAIMTLAACYIAWSRRQDDPSEIRCRIASIDAHF
jgi:hypothetical protein